MTEAGAGDGQLIRTSLVAHPGSRLEELLAAYETAKASAREAKDRLDAITDAIKAEGARTSPGADAIMLSGGPGLPRLRMTWKRSWRLDSKRLKEEKPELYVQYAVQSATWELREA